MTDLEKKKAYEVLLEDLQLQRYQLDEAIALNARQLTQHQAALARAAESEQARRFTEKLKEAVLLLKEKQLVLGSNREGLTQTIASYTAARDALVKTFMPEER